MKKVLLPLVAALALSASAQVPTTFNYQGVLKEASAQVTISFQVINANDYTVYQEKQEVTTNAAGAFTCVIGEGDATRGAWEDIDWTVGGYTVKTYLGADESAVLLSSAPLQAVPYANVAGSVAGYSAEAIDVLFTDVNDLVMANRENKTDIAEMKIWQNNVGENLEMLTPVINTLLDDVDALKDGADVLSNDVDGLVAANRENKTDIAEMKIWQNNVGENLEMLTPVINTLLDDVDALKDGVDVLSNDVDGLVSANRENKTDIAEIKQSIAGLDNVLENLDMFVPMVETMVDDIEALKAGADVLSTDVDNLVAANRVNATDIAEIKVWQANVGENLEMLTPVINTLLDDVEALKDGADVLSNDVDGLVAANRVNATDIAEIKVWQANVGENLEMLTPVINTLLDDVDALKDGADVLSTDVDGLVAANRENKTDIAEIKNEIAKLWNAAENADMTGVVAQEAYDKVLDLEDVVAENSKDIADMKVWQANVGENLEMLTPVINTLLDDVDALKDGADVLSNDVDGLVAANRMNATDIAEMKVWQANVGENLEMLTPVINTLLDDVDALKDGVDVLSNDVDGLVSANRENKTDIAEMKAFDNDLLIRVKDLEDALAKLAGEVHSAH